MSAYAHVDMRGFLFIDITQKRPVARVLHSDGVSYYIGSDGGMLPLSDNFTARVPVITGTLTPLHQGQNVSENPTWNALFKLMQTIRHDRFASALLEEVHREPSGELVLVPKLGECMIRFGPVENTESKLAKLRGFYEHTVHDVDLNQYESIDLRFKGQVVCKKHAL
jgi:cell division protein FtsQ